VLDVITCLSILSMNKMARIGETNNQQFFYMRLTFIHDKIHWIIKRIFRDEGLVCMFQIAVG
jgi:hypothetical protein